MAPRSSRVHPDLEKERLKATFDKEEITNFLDGSKEKTDERRTNMELFLSEPNLYDDKTVLESMSSRERYRYDLAKAMQLFRTAMRHGDQFQSLRRMASSGAGSIALPDGNPLGLHFAMFMPTILGQGTMEQQDWLGRAFNLEIIGTYAQTELGHGTFIRGLETTATYDATTQEFVLNSPTLSSYKWWPGGLGQTANYAVVMAQLVTGGVRRGPHAFMVQLREEMTHKPLKGINIGEIGPKLGMNSNDNGFLGFDNHRIPRDHMLMKNAQVLEDGSYVKPAKAQLAYGTMVMIRCSIVMDAVVQLKKAVTIAVRYSSVRRQSELRPGEPEPQILDYQTQQAKLFPALGLCHALQMCGHSIWARYEDNQELSDKGDLSALAELHALSCGMKALATQESADHTDVLRRACGGHGFMSSSNLPRLWEMLTASCTYEGENTVMKLQLARFLVKTCRSPASLLVKGDSSVAYLHQKRQGNDGTNYYLELFQRVARTLVQRAVQGLDALQTRGLDPALAWNNCSVELVHSASAHMRQCVIAEFHSAIKTAKLSPQAADIENALLETLAIHWILDRLGDFVMYSGVTHAEAERLRLRQLELFAYLRPLAVSLVDAFDLPDEALRSTLGSYDGQVYERLYAAALRSNQSGAAEEAHTKILQPLQKSNL